MPFLVIEAPTLTVDPPADGAPFENGAIPVQGTTTNAHGRSAVQTRPTTAPIATAGDAAPTPAPPARPPPRPGQRSTVAEDGTFDTPLELTDGRWAITVTATSAEGKTTTLTRDVTVAYRGVNLVVEIKGGRAWIKVWVDGKVVRRSGAAGQVYKTGKTLTFTARGRSRSGPARRARRCFTLNGANLGALGPVGNPETWLFAPPDEPVQTDRS